MEMFFDNFDDFWHLICFTFDFRRHLFELRMSFQRSLEVIYFRGIGFRFGLGLARTQLLPNPFVSTAMRLTARE